ncbi:pyrroloquinoline quinone biosynthesis peptide chaperone PqqD [Methylococcus capsulatus]|jgi:pyrroloquinoline quinone biosynthesis protein D|uniref:pyrroloquinoline quinone biosynthesis peptide chaperone PqqD n=1 Tax=Methylococcus capsulatus TaxID=414 RepID=UPI001C52D54F|nr:pyrroloquinoline quinone biosynthesis peptide chaperone PqqD [Methylococcus capsulatus]QXP87853.1 pyrroloquinoline quinone biosynthesis peptide chaperone PqqD [Methylococcus capsulatus]QXP92407.1 pyrroloquinoline quinone biosynthesis peptide chaperone PqqD [Methylococcus capsulatus]UQN12875.1 pyrroloquinoline quinone biosynthesis peptide chaperone PqqD [Methylococcus capsulatus]
MSLQPDTLLELSPLLRMQWEEAQQRYVILYPEGMIELNETAAAILELCDGQHNLTSIVDKLERKYDASGIEPDVREMLESALNNGWIREIIAH